MLKTVRGKFLISLAICIIIISQSPLSGAKSREESGESGDEKAVGKLSKADIKFISSSTIVESRMEQEGLVFREDSTESYLSELITKLTPPGYAEAEVGLHGRVLYDGGLLVVSFPNGGIYLSAGLFPRLKNEDQLAFLLAREIYHVTNHSIVLAERERKAKATAMVVGGMMLETFGDAYFGQNSVQSIAVKKIGSFMAEGGMIVVFAGSQKGYGKDREAMADKYALETMAKAGYNPVQAIELLKYLSRVMEDQAMPANVTPGFLINPKTIEERLAIMSTGAGSPAEQAQPAGAQTNEQYCKKTCLVRSRAGLICNSEKRFAAAEWIFQTLIKESKQDPQYHYYLGETYREWGITLKRDDYFKKAETEYKAALKIKQDYADPHLGLGYLFKNQGRREEAIKEFQIYLASAKGGLAKARAEKALLELQQ